MHRQEPGSLTTSRITTLPGGQVAEVVVDEETGGFARWCNSGTWSRWWPIGTGVRDVSIAAAAGNEGEPAALASVVIWSPRDVGVTMRDYQPYGQKFYLVTAAGITPASL